MTSPPPEPPPAPWPHLDQDADLAGELDAVLALLDEPADEERLSLGPAAGSSEAQAFRSDP